MDLVSAWRRQLLRASGAILIVPVGLLVAATVVGVGGGGFGGIGSLGQLVSGPAAPDAGGIPSREARGPREIASAAEDMSPVPGTTASSGSARGAGGAGGGFTPAPVRSGGTERPLARVDEPQTTPRRDPVTPPRPPPPEQPPAPTAPQQPAAPIRPVPPERGLLAPVSDLTRPVTDALPAPIGQTVQDLLDGLTGSGR